LIARYAGTEKSLFTGWIKKVTLEDRRSRKDISPEGKGAGGKKMAMAMAMAMAKIQFI